LSNLNALLLKEFQFLQYKKEVNKVGGSSSSVQPYYQKVLDRQTALRAGNQLNHPSPEEVYTKLTPLNEDPHREGTAERLLV
jgi:hypothetical protein